MGKLEREFLLTRDVKPQDWDIKPREWWRSVDDIFVIWTHGESSLRDFIESLNRHHPTIKFTATWSAQKVTFLNTTVYLKNGWIQTDLYVKCTDKHQYHHMDSCILFTVKLLSPIAKHIDTFVWRHRYLRIGPGNSNNCFFVVTMSST